MKTALAALVVLAATAARAQDINIKIDPGTMGMGVQVRDNDQSSQVRVESKRVEEHSGDGFKTRYESNDSGKTLLSVLAPEGAHVDIYDGTNSWASEDIPMSVEARSDIFYRFVIRWPNGAVFEKKLAAKGGMTLTLWARGPNVNANVNVVVDNRPPPPPPPQEMASPSMGSGDFESLKAAIEGESFSDNKLGVLRTAADGALFTADQVGVLIDLYSFSKDKLDALSIVKNKIVDRNNNFKILGHYTFSADKQKAQQLLR